MRLTRLAAPLFALLLAFAIIGMVNTTRLARAAMVTTAGDQSLTFDRKSPTGYAGEVRSLILPNHDAAGYQWIAQTQQAIARHDIRVRHVDYDNAPFGRTVLTPSPYRWWLSLVGRVRDLFARGPLLANVEQGALVADPAIEVLALLAVGIVAALEFGAATAAVLVLAMAFLFPFDAAFLAAQPDDTGATLVVVLLSVVTLLGALRRAEVTATKAGGALSWFIAAGALAGCATWLNAAVGMLVAVVFAVAALIAEAIARGDPTATRARGRGWLTLAATAAAVTLLASVIEYYPDYLDGTHLEYVHPYYGFAWLALGGAVSWCHRLIADRREALRWRPLSLAVLSLGVIATIIVLGWRNGSFAVAATSFALTPTHLDKASGSDALWQWLSRDGSAMSALGLVVPLAAIAVGATIWWRTRRQPTSRVLAIAVIAAAVLLIVGAVRLSWLGVAEVATIALLIPLVERTIATVAGKAIWCAAALAVVGLGAWLLHGEVAVAGNASTMTEGEVVALVERDLAQWLAGRAGPGGAVVLAPPSLSTSLYYHGNLRVLGTPYWENKDGMQAAVRLAGASSPDEGLTLAGKREIRFIALPSWDDAMDRLVRLTSNAPDKTILGLLHQWQAPRWLRPLPYPLPAIPGFEDRSVAVFEVVEVQENSVALSRLAECFLEMGRLKDAGTAATVIAHNFPADLGGHVARANVAAAYGDTTRLAEDMQVLTNAESLANASTLPWDRQVSYAVALAQGQRFDLAKQVAEHALAEIDEAKLRFLTPQSLYRLQLLCKVSGLEIGDPKLRNLARELLPPEIRDKV